MKVQATLAGLLLAVLVLSGCNPATESEDGSMMDAETMEAEEQMMDSTEMEMDSGEAATSMMVDENAQYDMEIGMENFAFSEDILTMSPGETMTIKVVSTDGFHDFVIDELNVESPQLQTGEEALVTITIPDDVEPGTEYEYYCSVGEHRANGMVGKLIIE